MKKQVKKLAVYLVSGCLMISTFTVVPQSPFSMEAEAHSGRTDANGGHRDNKNKSGLGSYHYHCGGHPAHLHPNGVCPYAAGASETQPTAAATEKKTVKQETQPETQPETQAVVTGWQQDSAGWWYRTGDGQFYKDGWQLIDGKWYYFDANGYMKTGWLNLADDTYYLASDGHMVTGEVEIDGTLYYFNGDGILDETYYEDDYSSDYDDDYDDWDHHHGYY